jgi:peroxiredoxin
MRSDIVPGGAFPDYELPDHTGTLRRLSELQGDDPLILTLARPLLPKGTPAASGTRRLLPEDRRGLHPDHHDLHR